MVNSACTRDANAMIHCKQKYINFHILFCNHGNMHSQHKSREQEVMGALGNLCMARVTRIPTFGLHSAGSRIPKVCGPCSSPLVTPLHYNQHVTFSNKSTSLHVALVLGCDATRNVLWTISSQHNGTSGCNQSLKPKTKKVARWPCWSLGRPAVGQGSPMWQGHISSLSPNGLLYSELPRSTGYHHWPW